MHNSNSLALLVVPPFVLFSVVQRPLFQEATFLLHQLSHDGLSKRGNAHGRPFKVFIDDPDVNCFAGDPILNEFMFASGSATYTF